MAKKSGGTIMPLIQYLIAGLLLLAAQWFIGQASIVAGLLFFFLDPTVGIVITYGINALVLGYVAYVIINGIEYLQKSK